MTVVLTTSQHESAALQPIELHQSHCGWVFNEIIGVGAAEQTERDVSLILLCTLDWHNLQARATQRFEVAL